MKRAIVLSGGGSKGAYEIGVWAALRKLKIKYDIVTGTSVGALNAAIMTQQTFYKGLKLWMNLDSKMIFGKKIKTNFKELTKEYTSGILHGGMDVTALQKTIDEFIDLDKIKKSKIDLGIVAFNVDTFKPTIIKKNDIDLNKLSLYLLASASCFPAFQMKKIDEQKYIDGGFYDNLPINLAIDMGATEVIAVDLKEIGFKKKVKNHNIPIKYISPRNNIGSFLIFDSTSSKRAIKLGYNDTLKEFGKLDGNKYTFKHNHLKKNYKKNYRKFSLYVKKVCSSNNILTVIPSIKKIINNKPSSEQEFTKIIELLGKNLNIDETNVYSIKIFHQCVEKSFSKLNDEKNIEKKLKQTDARKVIDSKNMIKYFHKLIKTNSKKLQSLIVIFPYEFLEAVYIKTIIEKI